VSGRSILAVYAHPDDETSSMAGSMSFHAERGVDIRVVTATRGELGTLGTGGLVIEREGLGAAREAEERAVLQSYGLRHSPVMLPYRDQELRYADRERLVSQVLEAMRRARPECVFTFGPTGISRHPDHIAIHEATVEAFHRYRDGAAGEPRLLYTAIHMEEAKQFGLDIDGPEVDPNVYIPLDARHWAKKVAGLRAYRSQEDAQWLADMFEKVPSPTEAFHQAWPPLPPGTRLVGLWPGDGVTGN